MSAEHFHVTSVKGFELAAGGLVWKCDDTGRKLAIVHRSQPHNDWALPKGRSEKDETPQQTALREAMEETRQKASVEKFAGSYTYFKEGRPKTVLIWHMFNEPEPYEKPAQRTEIDDVAWLSPDEAITRLTHQTEREFVARHCQDRLPEVIDELASEPKRIRLRAALNSSRWKLQARISRPGGDPRAWWVPCALKALATTEMNLKRGDLHGGWGAIHDAERFMVFGMPDAELVRSASKLKAETGDKLKNWRRSATDALLNPLKLSEWLKSGKDLEDEQRTLLQHSIVESLGVLNEHSDNVYHRMYLVERQLNFLVKACAALLVLAFACSFLAPINSPLRFGFMLAVSLAGALGGIVSAMYQLSRVGEAKIPEALVHGLITGGRPLVGAASALFVYCVIQSNIVNIIDASKVNLLTGLVLGFVAGFSERFVLKIVGQVAGDKDEKDSSRKTGGSKTNPPQEPVGGVIDPNQPQSSPVPAKSATDNATKTSEGTEVKPGDKDSKPSP